MSGKTETRPRRCLDGGSWEGVEEAGRHVSRLSDNPPWLRYVLMAIRQRVSPSQLLAPGDFRKAVAVGLC